MKQCFMKKMAALIVLIMTVLCFSGCIRYRTDMTVKKNGKADIELIYAVYADSDSDKDDELEESIDDLEDLGWEVDKYSKDKYKGLKLTMTDVKLTDLEEILTDKDMKEFGFEDFSLKKEGSKYILDWDTNAGKDLKEEGVDSKSLKEYGGYMEFNLELPKKPIDDNATDVSKDGLTLTWDLLEEDSVYCEFKVSNPIGIIIGICIAFLVAIAAAVVVVLTVLKKKKDPAEVSTEMPVTPVTPVDTTSSDDTNED